MAADLVQPPSLDEASKILEAEDEAMPIAGGTDVIVDLRAGRIDPSLLVDLSKIPGLGGIKVQEESIRLGSLTRVIEIQGHEALARDSAAIVEAARVLGSIQIRAGATIGGNVCNASPAADLIPPLLVFGAWTHISGVSGQKKLPVSEFFKGPRSTALARGDLLTAIEWKTPGPGSGSTYLRQTVRWAMDLAGVGVAASIRVDDASVVVDARVALGAVAPTPILPVGASSLLIGKPFSNEAAREVGRALAEQATPISDARGTEEYRRHVVEVLVARALFIAHAKAVGEWPKGVLAPTNGRQPGIVDI